MAKDIVLENCSIIDVNNAQPSEPCNIVIQGGKIIDITREGFQDTSFEKVDLSGNFLLPGLIDNHVHLTAAQFDLADAHLPDTYIAIQAKEYMENMLQRGFTSIRDAGGAGYGLVLAQEKGLINGPRLFLSGKALSQTGGHGDFFPRNKPFESCFCRFGGSSISIIADGVSSVRKAAREQFRKGASQIKIMASGGVASPTDNVNNVQFSEDEIRAIVDEANHANSYVMAHAYAPAAIKRCVLNGVRTIEHGNLLDRETAKLMHEHNAYLVPTMVIYHAIESIGKSQGFPEESLAKLSQVIESALQSVEIARSEKVKIGFGTDLLGPKAHLMQGEEFIIRSKGVESAHDIICSATSVNAEIIQHSGTLGIIQKNAIADLIALDSNPLDDIAVLSGQGEHLSLIMKEGALIKNTLGPA